MPVIRDNNRFATGKACNESKTLGQLGLVCV